MGVFLQSDAAVVVTLEVTNIQTNTIVLAPTWSVNVLNDEVVYSNGVCPAGMYCPSATAVPVPCVLGTYSAETGRSMPCDTLCPANHWCPQPTVMNTCPEHTMSGAGGVSKGDCICESGFSCLYKKQTSVQVLLHMGLDKWLHNGTVRDLVMQAVAEAAGVPVENVVVDYVIPKMNSHMGRSRALLSGKKWRGAKVLDVRFIITEKGEKGDKSRKSVQEGELAKKLYKLQKHHIVALSHSVHVLDHVRVRKWNWKKT